MMQVTVGVEDDGKKLFSFCHKIIINLSKRELRNYFSEERIFLNGMPVTDECHRVCVGNSVRIESAKQPAVTLRQDSILYCSPGKEFAVIYKKCGDSLNLESDFSIQFLSENNGSCDYFPRSLYGWYYGLDRGCAGLCVIIPTSGATIAEREQPYIRFLNNEVTLTFCCLVSGKVNCAEFINDKSGDLVQKLKAKILNQFKCRQTGYVSAVEITPVLIGYNSSLCMSEMMGAMSSLVKKIKSILNANNHRIVGDFDSVKGGKGLFISLVSFCCPLDVFFFQIALRPATLLMFLRVMMETVSGLKLISTITIYLVPSLVFGVTLPRSLLHLL